MIKFAVLEEDWRQPWEYIVANTFACFISVILCSYCCSGTDPILKLTFTKLFLPTEGSYITTVITVTILTAVVTWIIKNVTSADKVLIRQCTKCCTMSMQKLGERIPHWGRQDQEKEVHVQWTEAQCLQTKYSKTLSLKLWKLGRSSLVSAFTFDLIFLYYLRSAYHYKRGFFLRIIDIINDISLSASAFIWKKDFLHKFFELFGTLLQLVKYFFICEIMLFIELHDNPLTIGRSGESSAVTFDKLVSSLSSHS